MKTETFSNGFSAEAEGVKLHREELDELSKQKAALEERIARKCDEIEAWREASCEAFKRDVVKLAQEHGVSLMVGAAGVEVQNSIGRRPEPKDWRSLFHYWGPLK